MLTFCNQSPNLNQFGKITKRLSNLKELWMGTESCINPNFPFIIEQCIKTFQDGFKKKKNLKLFFFFSVFRLILEVSWLLSTHINRSQACTTWTEWTCTPSTIWGNSRRTFLLWPMNVTAASGNAMTVSVSS